MKKNNLYVIYQERKTLFFYILGCIAFIAIALLYQTNAEMMSNLCSVKEFSQCCFANPIYYEVLGKGMLGYFGLCSIILFALLIKPLKLFYINDEGFWAREYGFIKWDNVEDLCIKNIAFQNVICFNIKNKDELKVPFLRKIKQKLNKLIHKRDDFIGFSESYDVVFEIYKMMKAQIENV